MSENNAEETSVKMVFDLLSSTFKDTYDGLLKVLHEEPNYRHMLKMGERQFFDATNESTMEAQSKKSRLSFVATNFLAMQVDDDIDKMIQEKFQGEFLDKLKDDVLEAILQFSPDDLHSYGTAVKAPASIMKSRKDKEKEVSAPNKKLNSNGTKKSSDTRTQSSKVNGSKAGPSLADIIDNGTKKSSDTRTQSSKVNGSKAGPSLADINDSDLDLSCFSFESVSSVHTSDLSSFEDEITVSSDEESGGKSRRFSLKEIQEKLENDVTVKIENTDEDQAKSMQVEDERSNHPVNNNEISSAPQKSQRRRKPNLKYTGDDIADIDDILLTPARKQSLKKLSQLSRSACGDVPRKRGRPRKSSS